MTFDQETITTVFQLSTQIIGVASIIASMTPTPKDDGWLLVARKILSLLAFNVGKAKVDGL